MFSVGVPPNSERDQVFRHSAGKIEAGQGPFGRQERTFLADAAFDAALHVALTYWIDPRTLQGRKHE